MCQFNSAECYFTAPDSFYLRMLGLEEAKAYSWSTSRVLWKSHSPPNSSASAAHCPHKSGRPVFTHTYNSTEDRARVMSTYFLFYTFVFFYFCLWIFSSETLETLGIRKALNTFTTWTPGENKGAGEKQLIKRFGKSKRTNLSHCMTFKEQAF